jgi:hypothetical protein
MSWRPVTTSGEKFSRPSHGFGRTNDSEAAGADLQRRRFADRQSDRQIAEMGACPRDLRVSVLHHRNYAGRQNASAPFDDASARYRSRPHACRLLDCFAYDGAPTNDRLLSRGSAVAGRNGIIFRMEGMDAVIRSLTRENTVAHGRCGKVCCRLRRVCH